MFFNKIIHSRAEKYWWEAHYDRLKHLLTPCNPLRHQALPGTRKQFSLKFITIINYIQGKQDFRGFRNKIHNKIIYFKFCWNKVSSRCRIFLMILTIQYEYLYNLFRLCVEKHKISHHLSVKKCGCNFLCLTKIHHLPDSQFQHN